jgi:hypothetical protein
MSHRPAGTNQDDDMHTKYEPKNPNGREHLEDLGVDARIILKLILNTVQDRAHWWASALSLRVS